LTKFIEINHHSLRPGCKSGLSVEIQNKHICIRRQTAASNFGGLSASFVLAFICWPWNNCS